MSAEEEKQYVEVQVLKWDIKLKRVRWLFWREVLHYLSAYRDLMVPTKSKIVNTFKLWALFIYTGFIILVIVMIARLIV